MTRYHRIGTPADAACVLGDRPLECALCHTSASTNEILSQMEASWSKRYDREALLGLYRDLDRPTPGNA
jgi:hypothetical protein